LRQIFFQGLRENTCLLQPALKSNEIGLEHHIQIKILLIFSYLMTWFFPDVISSFPFDFLFTLGISLDKSVEVVQLLRIGKILAIIRIARITRQAHCIILFIMTVSQKRNGWSWNHVQVKL